MNRGTSRAVSVEIDPYVMEYLLDPRTLGKDPRKPQVNPRKTVQKHAEGEMNGATRRR